MGHAAGSTGRRRLGRSVVQIVAVSLDEVLDSWDDEAIVLPTMTPWRRRCRRFLGCLAAKG